MEDFEKLLLTNQPDAQALAREVRALVRRLLPRAEEKIYRGWGVADYGIGKPGRGFISIGPQKSYVNLYFMKGIELPDPGGLLEGTGKRLRHVKIRNRTALDNPALHALILGALALEQA